MRHLHSLMALVVVSLFIYQSYHALRGNLPTNRAIKIATHISYALIIGSGLWMLLQLMSVNAPVHWVFAKILLLVAAISASIKAFSTVATPTQRKIGIAISTIAYMGIIILAVTKPANFL